MTGVFLLAFMANILHPKNARNIIYTYITINGVYSSFIKYEYLIIL